MIGTIGFGIAFACLCGAVWVVAAFAVDTWRTWRSDSVQESGTGDDA